jgi:hypothetical protein
MFVAIKQIGAHMKNGWARTFPGQAGCHISRLDQSHFCRQPNRQQGCHTDH